MLLPAGVAGVGALELVALSPSHWLLAIAVEWVACALLVLRRHRTLPACTAAGLVVLSLPLFGPALDDPAAPILVLAMCDFSLARHVRGNRGLLPLLGFVLMLALDFRHTGKPFGFSDGVFVAAMLLPPYVLGLVVRALDSRNAALAAQAEELRRLQEQVRREAVAAERRRIARDLHDVIAHSLSAMVVQASVARELLTARPERAAEALDEVTSVGRSALAETGRLLHLVRDTDGDLGLEPAAGLGRLGELVEEFRRSGLDVALEVEGEVDDLPGGVDVSGYRLLREALTNALKHGSGQTSVRVSRQEDALVVETSNRAGRSVPGSGLGLVGMRERVSVFGGELVTHLSEDGLFLVRATLPLVEEPA